MHHLTIPWLDLRRADPHALLEIRFHREVLIGVFAGRNHVVLANVHDNIGLTQLPACDEFRSRREIGDVPFRGAGIGPAFDSVYFFRGKTWVVRKVSVLRVGKPRRHLAA